MRPPEDEARTIRTEDGLALEATITRPERGRGVALGCHPHPLFGGTMTNKVIHSFAKACRDQGLWTLRFNFRGAGRSGGSHGHGIDELRDVRAATAALFDEAGGLTSAGPAVVGGFSFGSHVGLRAAVAEPRWTHRVGIGLPLLRDYDFSFLAEDRRPLYLLAGGEDAFCPRDELLRLGDRIRAAGVPVEVVIIPAASHFFDRLGHVLRHELDRIVAHILGEPWSEGTHGVERHGSARD